MKTTFASRNYDFSSAGRHCPTALILSVVLVVCGVISSGCSSWNDDPDSSSQTENVEPVSLEFRVLAHRQVDQNLIDLALASEAEQVFTPGTDELIGWWIPIMQGEEDKFPEPGDAYSDSVTRRTEDDVLEVLVINDGYNVMGSKHLESVEAEVDSNMSPCVSFTLNPHGASLFAQLTNEYRPDEVTGRRRYLGIVLGGRMKSAPTINSIIRVTGQITGDFTEAEINDLVASLKAGMASPQPDEDGNEEDDNIVAWADEPEEHPLESKSNGVTLIYDLHEAEVDLDKILASVRDIIDPSGDRGVSVENLGDGKFAVHIPGVTKKEVEQQESRFSGDGLLEFRVLAHRDVDQGLIRLALQSNDKEIFHPDSDEKLGWWVPIMQKEEDKFPAPNERHNDSVTRRTEDDVLEVLVINDGYNVTGVQHLESVRPDIDENLNRCISFTLNTNGSSLFAQLTSKYSPDEATQRRRYLGIILRGEMKSAPTIQSTIRRTGQITGDFTQEEISDLIAVLDAGLLPIRPRKLVRIIEWPDENKPEVVWADEPEEHPDVDPENENEDLFTVLNVGSLPYRLSSKPVRTEQPDEDNQEGVTLVYDVLDAQDTEVDMDKMIAAIRDRIDPDGDRNFSIRNLGDDKIEIHIPGVSQEEADRMDSIIDNAGSLEFRIVDPEDGILTPAGLFHDDNEPEVAWTDEPEADPNVDPANEVEEDDETWPRPVKDPWGMQGNEGEETYAQLRDRIFDEVGEPLFDKPESLVQLPGDDPVYLTPDRKSVVFLGVVCQRQTMLEMFICMRDTTEHESAIAADVRPFLIQAGLLATGAEPGLPMQFSPTYLPPTGPVVDILLRWKDEEGEIQEMKAQEWVRDTETGEAMTESWVWTGSHMIEPRPEPETADEYHLPPQSPFAADHSGNIITIANFASAIMDLPISSTDSNEYLSYETFTEHIPPDGTPITVILTPRQRTPQDDEPDDDGETPAEETPVEGTPAEETPSEETPSEETPSEEAPAEETPVEETPVEEAPAEETPAEEITPEEETTS